MSIKNIFSDLFRDPCYDHRKVLNSEELIKVAQFMGYHYSDMAEVCGVSKTMISNWGNPNNAAKPTYSQLGPMFEKYGRGRFRYELEPLPAAAIEYKKYDEYIVNVIQIGMCLALLVFFWFISIKPCSDNWDECKELPWYRMGSFEIIKHKEALKEFKEWKRLSDGVKG